MNDSALIKLRPVEAADLPIFFAQQLDPEANRMAAFVGDNPADRAVFDARWRQILDTPGIVNRTILRGTVVAGHVACFPQDGKQEVTYWIGREHWGRGVATDALAALLQEIAHRPLFARVAKDNLGSLRVLQKCGFQIIGEDQGYAAGRAEQTEEYILRLDGDGR